MSMQTLSKQCKHNYKAKQTYKNRRCKLKNPECKHNKHEDAMPAVDDECLLLVVSGNHVLDTCIMSRNRFQKIASYLRTYCGQLEGHRR